ncbi:MAG: sulfite exporter TauE/SafE family protein [Clostridia bacterium]|nr:sulfite exporter TauE/SafE family protein [Clostridia bacterium]
MENKNKFFDILKLVGVGVVSGIINGFFGAGGGLLLVPLISFVQKDNSKKAHATTLVCVMFMCIASSVIYFLKKQIDYKLVLVCGIGSLIGSLVGTKLLKNLKNNIIDLVFSGVLILAGVCMIIF